MQPYGTSVRSFPGSSERIGLFRTVPAELPSSVHSRTICPLDSQLDGRTLGREGGLARRFALHIDRSVRIVDVDGEPVVPRRLGVGLPVAVGRRTANQFLLVLDGQGVHQRAATERDGALELALCL